MKKSVVALVLVALGAVAAYWWWSPYLAMSNVQAAARQQDAETFNAYVDYPRLRESIKGQLSAAMADNMTKETHSSDAARAGAALGTMLGMAMVNTMVENLVRPEFVMQAMRSARDNPQSTPSDRSGQPSNQSPSTSDVDWSFERYGADKLIAYSSREPSAKDRVGFVFERSGFASWKLTELRLPNLGSR